MVFIVCNVELDWNIQLSLCVRPCSFNIVWHEYVNEHDVSSEQPRPISWWKMQLLCCELWYNRVLHNWIRRHNSLTSIMEVLGPTSLLATGPWECCKLSQQKLRYGLWLKTRSLLCSVGPHITLSGRIFQYFHANNDTKANLWKVLGKIFM